MALKIQGQEPEGKHPLLTLVSRLALVTLAVAGCSVPCLSAFTTTSSTRALWTRG